MRRLALVCWSPPFDGGEMPLPMPSYGIHRIHAAARAPSYAHDVETRLFDIGAMGKASAIEAILDFEPDLVGFSVYVWSMVPLLGVAADLKRMRPDTLTLFGGPSARRDVFDHPHYREAASVVDAVCEGDGEAVIQALLAAERLDRAAMARVPGLWLRADGAAWQSVGALQPLSLTDVASPYQQGLMPAEAVAYLETYRGCPLSCRFCAWGAPRHAHDVFPVSYIAGELAAFRRLRAPAVFLLDAGLNLNAKAFRNLAEAQARDGFLSETLFWAEIYPTIVKPEHLDFLASVGTAYLGVGLQSIDEAVLRAHDRPFAMGRFAPAIEALARVAGLELQIIMGLPADTPAGFRKTLDFALSLPVDSVRVYHCLVLPDALLSRANPDWSIVFDPSNMTMLSNHNWTRADLTAMRHELDSRVAAFGGHRGEFWWAFRR